MPVLVDVGVELPFGLAVASACGFDAEKTQDSAAQRTVLHHFVAFIDYEDAFFRVKLFLRHRQRRISESRSVAHAAVVVIILGNEIEFLSQVFCEAGGETGLAGTRHAVQQDGNAGFRSFGLNHPFQNGSMFFRQFSMKVPWQDFPRVFCPEFFRKHLGGNPGKVGEKRAVQLRIPVQQPELSDIVFLIQKVRHFHIQLSHHSGERGYFFIFVEAPRVKVAQLQITGRRKENGQQNLHFRL